MCTRKITKQNQKLLMLCVRSKVGKIHRRAFSKPNFNFKLPLNLFLSLLIGGFLLFQVRFHVSTVSADLGWVSTLCRGVLAQRWRIWLSFRADNHVRVFPQSLLRLSFFLKITVFWNVAPCSVLKLTDVSEVPDYAAWRPRRYILTRRLEALKYHLISHFVTLRLSFHNFMFFPVCFVFLCKFRFIRIFFH